MASTKKTPEVKPARTRLQNLLVNHTPINNPSAVRADSQPVAPTPSEQGEHPKVAEPVAASVQPAPVVEVAAAPVAAAQVEHAPAPAPVQPEAKVEPEPQIEPEPEVQPAPAPQPEPAQAAQPAPQPAAKEPAPVDQTIDRPHWNQTRPSPTRGKALKPTNVSVPLDPDRFLRMSLARVYTGKTAIEIMTEALDRWLIDNNFPPQPGEDQA